MDAVGRQSRGFLKLADRPEYRGARGASRPARRRGLRAVYLHGDALHPGALENKVQRAAIWGPVLFGATYVVATVLFLPGRAQKRRARAAAR